MIFFFFLQTRSANSWLTCLRGRGKKKKKKTTPVRTNCTIRYYCQSKFSVSLFYHAYVRAVHMCTYVCRRTLPTSGGPINIGANFFVFFPNWFSLFVFPSRLLHGTQRHIVILPKIIKHDCPNRHGRARGTPRAFGETHLRNSSSPYGRNTRRRVGRPARFRLPRRGLFRELGRSLSCAGRTRGS